MMSAAVLVVCLLGGSPLDPPGETKSSPAAGEAEALAKYNALRETTPETAAGQWTLALWCEKHGLKAEAYAHFTAVVRLDPTREAAWKKLGFKKLQGRWLSEDDLAEDAEQRKADKLWSNQLEKIHRQIHVARKGAKAQEALEVIDDRRAAPSI